MAVANPAVVAEARRELARLAELPDSRIDLGEAGLALATLDHPNRDRGYYRALLAEMTTALGVFAASARSAEDRRLALSAVLAGQFGLIGDDRDEDELDSANLMQILDRRRGPAIPLGLLWLHQARQQSWTVEALSFPGHILLRLTGLEGDRVILDPYSGGRLLGAADLRDMLKIAAGAGAELAPGHYASQSNREVLLRLGTSIKLRYLRHAELRRALDTVEAMLLFAPDQLGLWREAGLMYLRQGNLRSSIAALEQFVARSPNSPARHRTSVLLQDLRSKLT